jgi:hypothetical protein
LAALASGLAEAGRRHLPAVGAGAPVKHLDQGGVDLWRHSTPVYRLSAGPRPVSPVHENFS